MTADNNTCHRIKKFCWRSNPKSPGLLFWVFYFRRTEFSTYAYCLLSIFKPFISVCVCVCVCVCVYVTERETVLMNSPLWMCSIVSPAFHIGLPVVFNPAPGELRPTDFSSNPNQTHLNQLITVFKATCSFQTGVLEQGWNWNLQDDSSPGAGLEIPDINS